MGLFLGRCGLRNDYAAVTESFDLGIIFGILGLPFFVGPTFAPLFRKQD
jgi:hypothetical protein